MASFRFQDLKVWQRSIEMTDDLLDIADKLESKKLYRFAEQLRGACLSISNNIAEGSGSTSKNEFRQFLNYARRSVFENANMLIVFSRRKLITEKVLNKLLDELDLLSRQIITFHRSL